MEKELLIKIDELIKAISQPVYYLNWSFWGTIVLIVTLIVLIIYTVETHKLAVQARDANLRPVVLRSGFLKDWNIEFVFKDNILIEGSPIEFTITKNIATSINGYIIIDKKKYQLRFGNSISEIENNSVVYAVNWGWMKPETRINAIYFGEGDDVAEKNMICIRYNDIEGNSYYTMEDENFSQRSYKGTHI